MQTQAFLSLNKAACWKPSPFPVGAWLAARQELLVPSAGPVNTRHFWSLNSAPTSGKARLRDAKFSGCLCNHKKPLNRVFFHGFDGSPAGERLRENAAPKQGGSRAAMPRSRAVRLMEGSATRRPYQDGYLYINGFNHTSNYGLVPKIGARRIAQLTTGSKTKLLGTTRIFLRPRLS